ncbi:hypothetical protein OIU76_028830 [Salix suchowensis]|nr:hypothetical protein OIU76_028830 [Salix suchowensis]
MATATMAATAAKLIKGGGSPQLLLSSSKLALSFSCCPPIIHKKMKPVNNIRLLISFSAARHNYHLHHSFCTTANVNADAISTSDSESQSGGEEEEMLQVMMLQVDVGEAEPRIICSGLVKYIPLDHLQQRNVAVLANLKPRNMRGVKSNGMLMAASDASHEHVELLHPPDGSIPGERIWFGSPDDQTNLPDPASPNQIQKKKIWESVQPHLKTDDSCMAILGGEHFMRTSAGVVASKSLNNANIS